jgi:predicted Zn-dependent protease
MTRTGKSIHGRNWGAGCRRALALIVFPALLAGVACSSNPRAAARGFARSGQRYMKQKKFSDAAIQFRNALQQVPTDWQVRYQLSEAEAQLGDWPASYRDLNAVLSAQPSFVPAILDLAQIDLMGGQTRLAQKEVDRALRSQPDDARAELLEMKVELAAKRFDAASKQCVLLRSRQPKSASVDGMCGLGDLGLRNLPAAEGDFRQALALDPGSASETRDLANVLQLENHPKQAERLLTQSARRYPNSLNMQLVLADFYVRQNQLSEADALLSGLFRHTPAFPGLAATLGDFWMNHNELTRAIADYQMAEASHPDPGVERNLASAYLTLRQIPNAERYTQLVLKSDPQSVDGRALEGALDYLKGNYAQASQELHKVVKDDPDSLLAKYYLGMTYFATGQLDRAKVAFNDCIGMNQDFLQAYSKLGEIALEQGDWRLGAAYARRVNQVNPSSFDAYLLMAQADILHNNMAQAGHLIAAAEKIPAAPPEIHQVAARYDILTGNFAAADKELSLATSGSPDPFPVIRWYDQQLASAGQYARAIAILRKEMPKIGPNASASVLLAELEFGAGNTGQAEAAARQALRQDSRLASAHDVLGEVFESRRQPAEAATEFATSIRLAPNQISAYLLEGQLLLNSGEYAQAQNVYDAARKQFPNSDPVALGLARTLAARGTDLDRALGIAQGLKTRFPENAEVADTLGWIYHEKGFESLALPQLELAARGLSNDATVQFHLGMTLIASGRKITGRAALNRALKLGLEGPDARAAKRALSAAPGAIAQTR